MRQPKKPKTRTRNSPGEPSPGRASARSGKALPQLTLRSRALRMLSRREYSRQELASRLRAYVVAVADADSDSASAALAAAQAQTPGTLESLEALLDDLAARGWLSDARYAEAVVRRRSGQYARRAIAQQLKRAGVDTDVTAAALAQNLPDPQADPDAAADAEFAAALALCQRKFRKTAVEQKDKARQVRFLQSRGYSLGVALRVLKQGGARSDRGEE